MGDKTNADAIGKALFTRQKWEPAGLTFLQRLNLAGYDVKGRVSSAYGQAGVSVTLGAGVDFGSMFVPFVHLEAGFAFEGECTAYSILLLQVMPRWVWLKEVQPLPKPPRESRRKSRSKVFPPADWEAPKPLAMAFLQGCNARIGVTLSADVWAGFGSISEIDETGISGIIPIAMSAKQEWAVGFVVGLKDAAPRHYLPTPSQGTLNRDVELLFEESLKQRVAAWLQIVGYGDAEMDLYGVPHTPLSDEEKKNPALVAAAKAAEAFDNQTASFAATEPIIRTGAGVIGRIRELWKELKDKLDELTTDELIDKVESARTVLNSWSASLEEPESKVIFEDDLNLRKRIIRSRLAEAKDLLKALEERQAWKAAQAAQKKSGSKTKAKANPAANSPPPFQLSLVTFESHRNAYAGAGINLPLPRANYQFRTGALYDWRKVSFCYQSYVPGLSAGVEQRLICNQETVITYLNFQVEKLKRLDPKKSDEPDNLGTMTYVSAIVNWFNGAGANNKLALPNGSGVSFGMSILTGSLMKYYQACKLLKKYPPGQQDLSKALSDPDLDLGDEDQKALLEIEANIMAQLRVTADELHAFMLDAPPGSMDEQKYVDAFVLESAFAFNSPVDLQGIIDAKEDRPKGLFKLAPVKSLTGKPAVRDATLDLQSIRLRFRIKREQDNSYSFLKLGWNTSPGPDWYANLDPYVDPTDPAKYHSWGYDPSNYLSWSGLAVSHNLDLQHVRRVGSEGIVELYQRLFPEPYDRRKPPEGIGPEAADALERRNLREISEMLVPPVTLFNY